MPQPLRIVIFVLVGLGILAMVGFFALRSLKRSDDPAKLIFVWILVLLAAGFMMWTAWNSKGSLVAALLPFLAIIVAVVLTPYLAPMVGGWLARPFTSAFMGSDEEVEPTPLYSIAEAQRKRGKFLEATHTIKEQLQRFPNDFTGHMMLAEIQAENMNDLPGAVVTVQRVCAQPNHPPKQIAYG